MNEYPQPAPENRSVRSARFFTSLQRYRNLFRRKAWLLFLMTGLAMGVAAVFNHFSPPKYVSFGRMISTYKVQLQTGATFYEELSTFLGTQAALMQSDKVRIRAEQRLLGMYGGSGDDTNILTLDPFKVMELRPDVKIGVSPKTSIFNLRATGVDSNYTQLYLQAVMDEFVNLKQEMRAQTSDKTLAGITEELHRLEGNLKAGENELLEFQGTNSVVFLQEQGNYAGTYLVKLNQQLNSLKSELQLLNMLNLEQNLERRQSGQVRPVGATETDTQGKDVSDLLPADSEYLKAKQQVQLLKAEYQQLSEFLRPKHPKMIALNEDIGRKEKLLEIFKQQSVEQLDNRKSSLELQIQNLEREAKDWEAKSLDASAKMAQYQTIKTGIARTQALYDQLLRTMQAVNVDKDITPEQVTILENATSGRRDRFTLAVSLLIAAFIGLALGVGILILTDRFDDRMNSFVELHDHFEEQVLGQIPRERHPGRGAELQMIQPEDTRHAFVESYRNVRSSLLFMSPNGNNSRPTLLLVTSSIPNDGKSMTTANLAITMAESGSRVLLVDADLRKGVMHRRFKLEAAPGFSEVLRKEANWKDVVQKTHIETLSVISCGTTSQKSSELFLQASTPALLQELAGQYDYVIIDSAPVMAADDVTSLAPHAQGVLFVVRAQHTSARVARAALDLLYQRNVNVLGLVFNAVNPDVREYYYYSKYKDYYSKPSKSKS